jgi:hypothetical protein
MEFQYEDEFSNSDVVDNISEKAQETSDDLSMQGNPNPSAAASPATPDEKPYTIIFEPSSTLRVINNLLENEKKREGAFIKMIAVSKNELGLILRKKELEQEELAIHKAVMDKLNALVKNKISSEPTATKDRESFGFFVETRKHFLLKQEKQKQQDLFQLNCTFKKTLEKLGPSSVLEEFTSVSENGLFLNQPS